MTNDRETALTFPCEFPIKIFGKTSDAFEVAALSIIRQHVPDLAETAISSRVSAETRYTALTITINATSQEQLDVIYKALNANEHVLMVL